jgi:hypothetical protein
MASEPRIVEKRELFILSATRTHLHVAVGAFEPPVVDRQVDRPGTHVSGPGPAPRRAPLTCPAYGSIRTGCESIWIRMQLRADCESRKGQFEPRNLTGLTPLLGLPGLRSVHRHSKPITACEMARTVTLGKVITPVIQEKEQELKFTLRRRYALEISNPHPSRPGHIWTYTFSFTSITATVRWSSG